MKKYIVLGIALLLAACSSLDKVSSRLEAQWVGKSYDEFVMEYGVTKASQKLQNGMTMHMWEKEGPDGANGAHCTLNILVDANNNITSIKANGDPKLCP